MDGRKAFVVGISGCSSSGKTTLARLLRDILPNTFILHQDDFYKPEDQLPSKDGLLDWDCAEAIDIPAMANTLRYIRQNGAIPETLMSIEDQNSVGECPVSASTVQSLKAKIARAKPPIKICILDGFLLFPPSMARVAPFIDIKLFLRASYSRAKARREARDGYATVEGFWTDPPGYVDKIVWPNYVREHSYMFEGGDVEGTYRADVLERDGIQVQAEVLDGDMEETLVWMVNAITTSLDALM